MHCRVDQIGIIMYWILSRRWLSCLGGIRHKKRYHGGNSLCKGYIITVLIRIDLMNGAPGESMEIE